MLRIDSLTAPDGRTQQSSFLWKNSPNCLQLLLPHTRPLTQSSSFSQSPSPCEHGFVGVQQGTSRSKFRPRHLLGEDDIDPESIWRYTSLSLSTAIAVQYN